MLYRRVNGEYVDANDRHEVVKYIDGTLKVEFKLRTTSKAKPVAGPDDMLVLLVQHWARDESVFPTEDDRHDVATIMLFQAYTGGRPAEFVHASKGKASEDPLGEREEANKNAHPRKATHCDHDEDSDADIDGATECDDDSNADDGPGSDDDMIFDSEDDRSDDGTADEDMDENSGSDSGYNSDRTDVTMTEDTDKCYTTEIDECGEPLRQNLDAAKHSEFEEVKRQYKALCYGDICLWIVQNPKRGERDLLAMEVHLQNHKGVDNKPKPTTFLFRENPLPILCPISHILTRAIRDHAVLVDGYTSAEPFFATDLGSQNVKAMKVHWKPEWLKRPVFRRKNLLFAPLLLLPLSIPSHRRCIFCVGNESLSYRQRTRKFRRVSHMWDHVENIHLRDVPAEQRIICHHPVCKAEGLILDGVILFKNHVATVHEVHLRPNLFPR
ncbi:hypothetical protein DL95DRAFT_418158 [Leptodontidium sp. 2 PMI_412]|nr:hypothetical protein DL95DRAFT_418158 [Leptodontidium sp. 2 PMI_412]